MAILFATVLLSSDIVVLRVGDTARLTLHDQSFMKDISSLEEAILEIPLRSNRYLDVVALIPGETRVLIVGQNEKQKRTFLVIVIPRKSNE